MLNRDTLSKEHEELEALANKLLVEVDAVSPGKDLSSLRWRLTHVLMVHLAKEDKVLYPRLLARPETRTVAKRFAEEMGDLGEAYKVYTAAWPIDRVEADWPGFGEATRKMMAALRRRIAREERDLYPRICESAPVVPSYAATNASIAPCKM
ncbi:hemerythrin domain-containing protein [Sphingomonas sp. MMS24-J45]|uniref:hemerythrin domain-containing protein n=1 Tax=Sphingomonas sp. MMS24-J45 TaxID=3238806 RepID=UPI00384F9C99